MADEYFDPVAHTGSLRIILRLCGVRLAPIRVIHLAAGLDGASPPDRGIPDRGSHFKNASGIHKPGTLIQKPAHGRPNNGHVVLLRNALHLREYRVTLRHETVHVLFDRLSWDGFHLL